MVDDSPPETGAPDNPNHSLTTEPDHTLTNQSHLIDADRMADVELKQRAIADLLDRRNLDAVLIQQPENFSWFTSGADPTRQGSTEVTAALFITADARVLVCSNVDSPRLFERELPRLGFQLKERPWTEPKAMLIGDLCRGRKVGSDRGFAGTENITEPLRALRSPLTPIECERLRGLGREVAHAVEATARNCWQGQTEAQIAGQLTHRLVKHQIVPERIQVCGDLRANRYRHWGYGDAPVGNTCIIAAIGRRRGLHVAVSRAVSFGDPDRTFAEAYRRVLLLQSTGMFFSQPEWELFEVWNRLARIYEKLGVASEWHLAEQAELIGYGTAERMVVPKSQFKLRPRTAVHWHPSVGPAFASDTILVSESGFEVVTPYEHWPQLATEVKGHKIFRPGILRRDDRGQRSASVERSTEKGDSILMSGRPQSTRPQAEPAPDPTASDAVEESDDAVSETDFDLDDAPLFGNDSIFGMDEDTPNNDSIFD